jgi:hypothetical protein
MGGEMTKVFTLDGKIINVGEWDYQIYQDEVVGNSFPGPMDAPSDWDYQISIEDFIGNPLPEGAIEQDREVFESEKGRLLLSDNWSELRADAYPPIKDQLDAMWKGGSAADEMAAKVQAVKDKYPAPNGDSL